MPTEAIIATTAFYVAWCALSASLLADTRLLKLSASHFSFWANLGLALVAAVASILILKGAVGVSTGVCSFTTAFVLQTNDAMPTWMHHFVPGLNVVSLSAFATLLAGTWLSFFPAGLLNPAPIPVFSLVVNDKTVVLEAYSLLGTSLTAIIALELNEIAFRLRRRSERPTMRAVVAHIQLVDVDMPVDLSFLRAVVPWKVAMV